MNYDIELLIAVSIVSFTIGMVVDFVIAQFLYVNPMNKLLKKKK